MFIFCIFLHTNHHNFFVVLAPNRLKKPPNEDAVHGSSLAWDLCNEHDFLLVCASGG